MNVTPARLDDLDDLAELIAEYQSLDDTADLIDTPLNREFLASLLKDKDHSALFVGRTSSGELIGLIAVHATPSVLHGCRLAQITDLFVHPDYRAQGFGRQLFNHAVRWARDRKFVKAAWYVGSMNLTAQYLFDRIPKAEQSGCLGYTMELE